MQHPQYVYATAGQYVVCLTVSDSCSTATFCDTISATVGIEEWAAGVNLNLAPNPVNDQLQVTVQALIAKDMTLQILDATGRLIYAEDIGTASNVQKTIATNELADGIYFLRISSESGSVQERFVKR